jgi:hypothetical protein
MLQLIIRNNNVVTYKAILVISVFSENTKVNIKNAQSCRRTERRLSSNVVIQYNVFHMTTPLLIDLPGVNFTNILRAVFTPIFLRQKYANL